MSITELDVKLLKSERLTDNTDGGGRQTANEVIDGQVNNLFPDISRLDRTFGRVSLRKAFAAIDTTNVDSYYGAHAIITDPPDDDAVHVTMFRTGSPSDERSGAAQRLQSYLAAGPRFDAFLYDRHLAGQKQILLFAQPDVQLPAIGDAMVLSEEPLGGGDPIYQFYFRITDISAVTQSFVTGQGSGASYQKKIITLTTSAALGKDLEGDQVTQEVLTSQQRVKVRKTTLADAATYFGIAKLHDAASIGQTQVRVDSIFRPVVPSTNIETAVIDETFGLKTSFIESGNERSDTGTSHKTYGGTPLALTGNLYTMTPVTPRSLTVTFTRVGDSATACTFTDDGKGVLVYQSGGSQTVGATGEVDYRTGLITVRLLSSASFSHDIQMSATYHPAAVVTDFSSSTYTEITAINRGFTYAPLLRPRPAAGTLTVSYRSLGRWFTLQDDGNGGLVGDAGVGTGTINYTSGSVSLTLGALPDLESALIYQWGTPTVVEKVDYAPDALQAPLLSGFIGQGSAESISTANGSITYTAGGQTKTCTLDAGGAIGGDGSGTVASNGVYHFRPAFLPDMGTTLDFTFDKSNYQSGTDTSAPDSNGVVSFTMAGQKPVRAGSVWMRYSTRMLYAAFARIDLSGATQVSEQKITATIEVRDDGNGNLRRYGSGFYGAMNTVVDSSVIGTINYTTGAITVDTDISYNYWKYNTTNREWEQSADLQQGEYQQTDGIDWQYIENAQTLVNQTTPVNLSQIEVNLGRSLPRTAVTGSVAFTYGGKTYYDRNGALLYDYNAATGSGTPAGSIQYGNTNQGLTCKATIMQWQGGQPVNDFAIASLAIRYGESVVDKAAFRTPSAPIRLSSFIGRSLPYNAPGAPETLYFSTDTGEIRRDSTSGTIVGKINFQSGWGTIDFDQFALGDTCLYNCVTLSNLPLDANILGLDPVRLPLDGRVPIFQKAGVVVIHSTKDEALPNPVTAGGTYTLSRTLLSWVKVLDATGAVVPTDKYTVDLDAGEITFGSPLDLSGFVQPLKARHRIEDMRLVSDVQITGHLGLVGQLSHHFDPADTYVSSALIPFPQDLQARYSNLLSQSTWTSVWSDALIGSAPNAQYNDLAYPLGISNRGAVTERWRIHFTNSTAFQLIGETLGVVATGDIFTDFNPPNPLTGQPYFFVDKDGWGSGWGTGNLLRFNTIGANFPIWFVRTTLSGPVEEPTDHFKIEIRGDAD